MCNAASGPTVMRGEGPLHHGAAERGEPLVVSCGCNSVQEARLRDALRGVAQFRSLSRVDSISPAQSLQVPDIVVIAIEAGASRDYVAFVRELRCKYPRTALVAYCGPVADTPASIGSLAVAGVHQFVFADVNDRRSMLCAIIESARQQCVAEVVAEALRIVLPPVLQPIIEAALTRPDVVSDVSALAKALGVHRKTVFNRCARVGNFGPQELLTWIRLALVAHLLESTDRTVEEISLQLAYPSPTALRNTIKRHVGLRAMEIRHRGGLELVVERLRERIHPAATRAIGDVDVAKHPAELHAV